MSQENAKNSWRHDEEKTPDGNEEPCQEEATAEAASLKDEEGKQDW